MKKLVISLAGLMTLLIGSHVIADPTLQKGTKDLSLVGSPDFTGPSGDTLSLDIGFGLFVRDNFIVRGTLSHAVQEDIAPGNADYRATEYNLVGEYHFDFGWSTVPYIGADLGWRRSKFGSIREDGFIYGPRLGIKYFLDDNIAIDVSISYKFSGNDVFVSDCEIENKKILFGFGLRYMF